MKIEYGTRKLVIVFKLFVIKFPKIRKNLKTTWENILMFYSEQLVYIMLSYQMKEVICPTYFLPLVLVLVQPRCDTNVCKAYVEHLEITSPTEIDYLIIYTFGDYNNNALFKSDLNPKNIGLYNGKLVKFDLECPLNHFKKYFKLRKYFKDNIVL